MAVALIAFGLHRAWELARIGAAYKAKILCSAVFVSGRDPASVLATDLSADDLARLNWFDARVDNQTVVAGFLGLVERRAVHRDGLACALGVTIVPGQRLVVVRLGLTRRPAAWDHALFIRRVLDSLAMG